jgi:hypothetical protein
VEPGGEADEGGVVRVLLQYVDVVEDRGEVREGVVSALWLLPAGEEVVRVRDGVGAAGGAGAVEGMGPAGAQRVEVGHASILPLGLLDP